MTTDLVGWAERIARDLLEELPRRLSHVEGVVRQSELAADVVDDPEILLAAAWLHDIGYSEEIVQTGFHPVDGAEYLRAQQTLPRLCALVAHHSCARVEARRRRIDIPWPDECTLLRDALWWADMTTTPTGDTTDIRSRICEVRQRYGADHIVSASVTEAEPDLLAAGERIAAACRRAQVK
ncbi:HD domain-containing protein [Nocardia takedensis]|uniref:HD domain-containing protein n=1 Tax=Nocardia takedensis TaxID=259390 RepID=UPI003F75FC50